MCPSDEPRGGGRVGTADRRGQLPAASATVAQLRWIWSHPSNRSSRLSALARAVRAQTWWRATGRPTTVPFGDDSLVVARFDGGSSQRAAYARLPDHNEMLVWINHLSAGDLFVDVGANAGLYSLLACELGADVIAIEPLVPMTIQLAENLALNDYEAEIVPVVVGRSEGTARFQTPDLQRAHVADSGEEVPMSTLDAIVGDRTVAGVKIDVEGAELDVLVGAMSLLTDQRAELIQLEWNDRSLVNFATSRSVAAELLDDLGYELLRPDVDGVLRPSSSEVGADLFARPREKLG